MRAFGFLCFFAASASAFALSDLMVELDLTKQRAILYQDGEPIDESPISSGRESHPTPVGDFEVIEKDIDHRSSLYGKLLNAKGGVVKSDADKDTPVPPGCHFERAPMRFFMRFSGAAGMHAGKLPGYPASHGCVRMPLSKAEAFYRVVEVGTPVHVHGTPPWRGASDEAPKPRKRSVERDEDRPRERIRRVEPEVLPPPPPPVIRRRFFWF